MAASVIILLYLFHFLKSNIDIFLFTKAKRMVINQARNHKVFRTGEVSWKKETLINNSFTTHERKTSHGKTLFFLLDTLKTTF